MCPLPTSSLAIWGTISPRKLIGPMMAVEIPASRTAVSDTAVLLPLLPFVAWHVLRGKGLKERESEIDLPRRQVYSVVALSSFVVGMYDGFYGPGTGTFLILLFTAFAGMRVAEANGTSKLINLASNTMSLLIFLINGQVILLLGIVAALCSILGNYIGSSLVMKNGITIVRPLIIAVLAILFLKILMELL